MYYFQHYKIDFEKVNDLESVLRILKAMNISFERDDPSVHEIKDLVKLVDKESDVSGY